MTIDEGGSYGIREKLRQVISCSLLTPVDNSSLKRKTLDNGTNPSLGKSVIDSD